MQIDRESALVVALLIVPGYQLVRGYAVARGDDAPRQQMYVFAQAFVASIAWLIVTWPLISDFLQWVADDTVKDNLLLSYLAATLLIGTPYVIGRWAGVVAARMTGDETWRSDKRWADLSWPERFSSVSGITDRRTTSPLRMLWTSLRQVSDKEGGEPQRRGQPRDENEEPDKEKPPIVRIALDNGAVIYAEFTNQSYHYDTRETPDCYFESAYERDENTGNHIRFTGQFIAGKRIVTMSTIDTAQD